MGAINTKINDLHVNGGEAKTVETFSIGASYIANIGQVVSVKDGVAYINHLTAVAVGELVDFGEESFGMVLNLEKNLVGAVIFGDDSLIKEGQLVKSTGKLVEIPVGPEMLGRVINALGAPIDGKGAITASSKLNVERKAPGVITRKSVTEPLLTGYKVIDSMLPIGRGQRELIIGDRQTGKTTLAVDAIINQRSINTEDDIEVKCVYVGVGQKKSSILQILSIFETQKALYYTTIVAATAAESASLQFISAYTGCAVASTSEIMDNIV